MRNMCAFLVHSYIKSFKFSRSIIMHLFFEIESSELLKTEHSYISCTTPSLMSTIRSTLPASLYWHTFVFLLPCGLTFYCWHKDEVDMCIFGAQSIICLYLCKFNDLTHQEHSKNGHYKISTHTL